MKLSVPSPQGTSELYPALAPSPNAHFGTPLFTLHNASKKELNDLNQRFLAENCSRCGASSPTTDRYTPLAVLRKTPNLLTMIKMAC